MIISRVEMISGVVFMSNGSEIGKGNAEGGVKIKVKRPISPHISIYKPQITSVSSIIGRICGFGSAFLAFVAIGFLVAAKQYGFDPRTAIHATLLSQCGFIKAGSYFILFGSLFVASFYWFCLFRHILWDFGYCLNLDKSKRLGYLAFGFALFVSVSVTVLVYYTFKDMELIRSVSDIIATQP